MRPLSEDEVLVQPRQVLGKTGYKVPIEQRSFGPPEGPPPQTPRKNSRDEYDKYLKTKKEMLKVLEWYDEEHAELRPEEYDEAGEEEENDH